MIKNIIIGLIVCFVLPVVFRVIIWLLQWIRTIFENLSFIVFLGPLKLFLAASTLHRPTGWGVAAFVFCQALSEFLYRYARKVGDVKAFVGLGQFLDEWPTLRLEKQVIPEAWLDKGESGARRPIIAVYRVKSPKTLFVQKAFIGEKSSIVFLSRTVTDMDCHSKFALLHELGHLCQNGAEAWSVGFILPQVALLCNCVIYIMSLERHREFALLALVYLYYAMKRWFIDQRMIEPELVADCYALQHLDSPEVLPVLSDMIEMLSAQASELFRHRNDRNPQTPQGVVKRLWRSYELYGKYRVVDVRRNNFIAYKACVEHGITPPIDLRFLGNPRQHQRLVGAMFAVAGFQSAPITWVTPAAILVVRLWYGWRSVIADERVWDAHCSSHARLMLHID